MTDKFVEIMAKRKVIENLFKPALKSRSKKRRNSDHFLFTELLKEELENQVEFPVISKKMRQSRRSKSEIYVKKKFHR